MQQGILTSLTLFLITDQPCRNDAGYNCLVPFEYNGVKHWKCTTEGHDEPWCYDERGNESWDTCSNCTEGILTRSL